MYQTKKGLTLPEKDANIVYLIPMSYICFEMMNANVNSWWRLLQLKKS